MYTVYTTNVYDVYFFLDAGIPGLKDGNEALRGRPGLQGAEQFVEFVGGVEVGFQVPGGQPFAEIVETAGE